MGCGSSSSAASRPEDKGKPAGRGEKPTPAPDAPKDESGPMSKEEEEALKELNGEPAFTHDKKTGDVKAAGDKSKKIGDDELFDEEKATGDKFMAVKPWKGAVVAPTSPPPNNPNEPEVNYKLEYVYGYRTYDCRQNLFFTPSGKLVYNAAALGISHDIGSNTQTFFGGGMLSKKAKLEVVGHDDDILCLAISPDRKCVATGQVGPKPTLCIWDADTCAPIKRIQVSNKDARGIACVAWSEDGQYLAFVDKHNDHNVYVYKSNGQPVYNEKSGPAEIFAIAWSKARGDNRFAIVGQKMIGFWEVGAPKQKKGTGHGGQTFSSVTFDPSGKCYAGAITGEVYTFDGQAMGGKKKAHQGTIHTMSYIDGKLITGGQDKKLIVWDAALSPILTISLPSIPRACDMKDGSYAIGMRNGTVAIYKGDKEEKIVMKSHHDGEVWGLEIAGEHVITSCDDNKIMVWDPKTRTNLAMGTLNKVAGGKQKYGASSLTAAADNQCARAVCYNPATGEVAFGLNDGTVQIRKKDDLDNTVKSIKAAERWIEFMAYSPSGEYLAVGTHSNTICVYTVPDYVLKGKLTAHKSSITSLDWSKDSKYIRSVCEAYELLFFKVPDCVQDTSGATSTRDIEWASQRTKLGWYVDGIFPPYVDGTHINGVDRSEDGKLIITGDDYGLVNIFRCPVYKDAKYKALRGHSEHVVRVKFGFGDSYIFSVGGQDKTLMQWKRC
jgi:WD40 repeat protein